MLKMHWATLIGLGVISAVAIAATSVVFWLKDSQGPGQLGPPKILRERVKPNIDVALLTHEKSINGSWKRVALPEDQGDDVYGWRQINAAGKMLTLYGDVILDGSYRIIDKKTIETTYRFKGEVNSWTFGFLDGKLIMIHKEYGWVEAYESVPVGTIDPSLDP